MLEIPPSGGCERYRDLGVTDARDIIAVAIDLRDEMEQRHELAADYSWGPTMRRGSDTRGSGGNLISSIATNVP